MLCLIYSSKQNSEKSVEQVPWYGQQNQNMKEKIAVLPPTVLFRATVVTCTTHTDYIHNYDQVCKLGKIINKEFVIYEQQPNNIL